jgi:hypothetical protein
VKAHFLCDVDHQIQIGNDLGAVDLDS